MNKLCINDFGIISHIELNLDKNIDIIIGAQASGKSTLSKTVYFCKKIKDYLLDYLTNTENFIKIHPNEHYTYFLKLVRKQFMGCFGTTKHMRPFQIEFFYNYNKGNTAIQKLTLSLDEKNFVKVIFSKDMADRIKSLIGEAAQLYGQKLSSENELLLENLLNDLRMRQMARKHFEMAVYDVFCDTQEVLYIPAGRGVLSTLSEQLHDLDLSIMDLPLKEFIEQIQTTKKRFGTKIPDIIDNYTKTITGQIQNAAVQDAYTLIKSILKGDYISDTDGEKLYYSPTQWVKLMYASSGQQEVLWILLIIFIRMLENKRVFLVVEEPEAHLFPSAQKKVLELLALLVNTTGSQIIITTHSPYILTSANLLVYSGKVESDKRNQSHESIIPRQFRISPEKMEAFLISNTQEFSFSSIKDKNEGIIDPTYIDEISSVINRDTDRIIDLELKYDM